MKGDREKTIEAGCDGYIAKPIDIKEVLKTIETYLTVKQVSV
jgi:two-component system cell cycle response regulator DivK